MYNPSYILTQPVPSEQIYSNTQFEIIRDYILEFQQNLDEQHDVGLLLAHMGGNVVMEVTQVSFEEPVLMVFKGYVNGREATLIQHISQLNFLLTTVDKNPTKPHRTIGFTVNQAEQ